MKRSLIYLAAIVSFCVCQRSSTAAAQVPELCAACSHEGYDGPMCQRQLAALRRSLEREPGNALLLKDIGVCMWDQSFMEGDTEEAHKKGRDESVRLLRESLKRDPANIQTEYELSWRVEDLAEREKLLRDVVNAEPTNLRAREDLATILLFRGQVAEAFQQYMTYLSRSTLTERQEIMDAVVFGDQLKERGRIADAAKIYKATVEHASLNSRFERCLMSQDIDLDALSAYPDIVAQLRDLRPYCVQMEHRNKAVEFLNKGRFSEAIEELQLQLATNPKYEETYGLLAGLYRRTGQIQKAFATLRSYVEQERDPKVKCDRFSQADWTNMRTFDPAFFTRMASACAK
jgi:tetratricopeptide (TPR) repeat protein